MTVTRDKDRICEAAEELVRALEAFWEPNLDPLELVASTGYTDTEAWVEDAYDALKAALDRG